MNPTLLRNAGYADRWTAGYFEVNMKAIETVYNGYRFRSRLEARWAVFFDTLGIQYRYEPEGFDLDGVWYLPDFWLPNREAWVEIKPEEPTELEWERINRLAEHEYRRGQLKTVESEFGYSMDWLFYNEVIVLVGEPYIENADQYEYGKPLYVAHRVVPCVVEHKILFDLSNEIWVQCRGCNLVALEGRMFHYDRYDGKGGGYGFCHSERPGVACSSRLLEAYRAARQARFGT